MLDKDKTDSDIRYVMDRLGPRFQNVQPTGEYHSWRATVVMPFKLDAAKQELLRNYIDGVLNDPTINKALVTVPQMLSWIASQHPELGMTAIDDRWPEENFYGRSDHYNFAKHGVPILFFFNGVHADYHQVSDSPDKINADKESRILQLLFYLGQAVANNPERPKWNPDSYAKIVRPLKPAS